MITGMMTHSCLAQRAKKNMMNQFILEVPKGAAFDSLECSNNLDPQDMVGTLLN
jgi:hypothetical protein